MGRTSSLSSVLSFAFERPCCGGVCAARGVRRQKHGDAMTRCPRAGPKYEWVPAESWAESGGSSTAGSSDGDHTPVKGSSAKCAGGWTGSESFTHRCGTRFLVLDHQGMICARAVWHGSSQPGLHTTSHIIGNALTLQSRI